MNFSFSRILYIMRTLISSTMKIARKKMKITKNFLDSCDFPGVLEKKECLTGTPLGLYGIPGPIHKQTQIPVSTFPVFKSFDLLFRTKKSVQDQSLRRKLRTWRKTRSQACGSLRSQRQSGAYRLQLMVASCH